MKIAFPEAIRGGSSTWITLMSRYLKSLGHEITFDLNENFDLLINMADILPLQQIQSLRRKGVKILYRMDGLYWKYLSPPNIVAERNQQLLKIMDCSDRIVFQSRFVRSVIAGEQPEIMNRPGEVIYNAADPKLFHPWGEKISNPDQKIVILVAGNWGPPGLSLPLLQNYIAIARKLLKEPYEFWLFGPVPPEVMDQLQRMAPPPNLRLDHLGLVERNQLPRLLRTVHLLLYLRPNDPCPHLVIEAMACGTPIVGLNSGSMPELLGNAALLARCEASTSHFPRIGTGDVIGKIAMTVVRNSFFRDAILERSKMFSLETIGRQYLTQMELALSSS